MNKNLKFLLFFAVALVALGSILIGQVRSFGKLRLIFCDVGQGDGILIMTPGGQQVIIDGGPGTKIAECLSSHMPFWDRTIEMMLLTHPQKDHMEGQVEVFVNYRVEKVFATGVKNESEFYGEWQKEVEKERSVVNQITAGDKIQIGENQGSTLSRVEPLTFNVLWPTTEKLALWKIAVPADLNESSIVLRLDYGQVCAYLTGDIPKETLETLIDRSCQILKIAHHGSKTGTNAQIIDLVKPKVAVIQSGKNSYGHPHKEVLDLLEKSKVMVLRNDLEGDIELIILDDSIVVR